MLVEKIKIKKYYNEVLEMSGYKLNHKLSAGYIKYVYNEDRLLGRWHVKFGGGVWIHYDKFQKSNGITKHYIRGKHDYTKREVRLIEKNYAYICRNKKNDWSIIKQENAPNLKELQQEASLLNMKWTDEMFEMYYGMSREKLIEIVKKELYGS